jgi:hypothetical protein
MPKKSNKHGTEDKILGVYSLLVWLRVGHIMCALTSQNGCGHFQDNLDLWDQRKVVEVLIILSLSLYINTKRRFWMKYKFSYHVVSVLLYKTWSIHCFNFFHMYSVLNSAVTEALWLISIVSNCKSNSHI